MYILPRSAQPKIHLCNQTAMQICSKGQAPNTPFTHRAKLAQSQRTKIIYHPKYETIWKGGEQNASKKNRHVLN